MKFAVAVPALASTLLIACSTVTIRPEGGRRDTRASTFQERKSFWFWGLVGEGHVDVKKVCGEKSVDQMQSGYTGGDVFLNIITLGLYAPRTAKVWCK